MTTKCYDYHSGAQSLFEGFCFQLLRTERRVFAWARELCK